MHNVFLWLSRVWLVAYVVALLLFIVGVLGLFGQPRDPLSGIFLIPLGFPWFFAADAVPAPGDMWVAALAPIVNIIIFRWLAKRLAPKPA
jgi:hypothetical protein